MGKKKNSTTNRKKHGKEQEKPDLIADFLQRAQGMGLTYAQLQVMETCELIRKAGRWTDGKHS